MASCADIHRDRVGATTLLGHPVGGVFAEFDAWWLAFGCVITEALGLALIAQLAFPVSAADNKRPGLLVLQLVLLAATVLGASVASVVPTPPRQARWHCYRDRVYLRDRSNRQEIAEKDAARRRARSTPAIRTGVHHHAGTASRR